MKKNVKILGAAAAALLAVAPVAAGVVPAAGTNTAYAMGDNSGRNDVNAVDLNVSLGTPLTVADGTKASDLTNLSQVSASVSEGYVSGIQDLGLWYGNNVLVSGTGNHEQTEPVKTGFSYLEYAHVVIKGLVPGRWYVVPAQDGQSRQIAQAHDDGSATFLITRKVNAINSNLQGQPYFTDTANSVQLGNGATLPGDEVGFNSGETLSQIERDAKSKVNAWVAGEDGKITSINNNVSFATPLATQLSNQGVTTSNGRISNSARNFNVTLTATNPLNGKTATIVIPFSANANNNMAPAIWYYPDASALNPSHTSHKGNIKVAQGSEAQTQEIVSVKQGSRFNISNYFKAWNTNDDKVTTVSMYVVKNDVNTNVAGLYPVTVRATNANGLTTTYNFEVAVMPTAGSTVTVQYPANYGVLVWNLTGKNGNTYTNAANSHAFVKGQSPVRVMEIATVNGVSYSRIEGQDSNGNSLGNNAWIQTAYLDGSWNHNNNSNHNNNGEESVLGVATVTYKGKGGVRLLNADGKYQNQIVKKGSSWKVFAKKTINGTTMYRLGTENQWIPSGYVNVR